MSGDIFVTIEGWALLASRGRRPRMPPNTSLGGGAPDSQRDKELSSQNVNRAMGKKLFHNTQETTLVQ